MAWDARTRGLICTQVEVGVSAAQARQWFLSLKTQPQRYRFVTHDGVVFVSGDFGKAGARFYTRERFLGVKLTLHFELTAVDDAGDEAAFRFKLLKPLGGQIWGEFAVTQVEMDAACLSLHVGAASWLGTLFLHFYPVTVAVHHQIRREVAHIKVSMEQTCA